MAGLDDLRQMLDDRIEKDPGLKVNAEVVLESWRIRERARLEDQLRELKAEHNGRLSGADTADLDNQIQEQQDAIEASTLVLHFQALSTVAYRNLLEDHPETKLNNWGGFLATVASKCYRGCKFKGAEYTADQMPLDGIRQNLSDGEWDPIVGLVMDLNREKAGDRPF